MIIQGSNNPIIVEFNYDMQGVTTIEAGLFMDDIELKHWSGSEIDIDEITGSEEYNYSLSLPLKEAETMYFPDGRAVLEVKWMDADGLIRFLKEIKMRIGYRRDKTLMED